MMFTLEDEAGELNLLEYSCAGGNSILLEFDRDIGSNAKIGCRKMNQSGLMPYDVFSYLPVIPFDEIRVSTENTGK